MSGVSEDEAVEAHGPIAWMARNHVASNVLMFVLILGGIATFLTSIKQEVFPTVELDTVMVQVGYPGASPAEVEQGVALAVEEAVRGIEGVKEVRSTSIEGGGAVAIDLLLGADPDRALSDVKSAVDRITSFPEDVERPVVSLASSKRQVLNLMLYGDVSEETLFDVGEEARHLLLQDPGITYVELAGVRPLEISIEVPQENLRRYGLTLQQVAEAIRQTSVELPAGGVKTEGGEILLRTAERRDRGSDFADVIILSRPDGTQVRVRDVAIIDDGFSEVDEATTFNGQPAVILNVYREGDETPISVSHAVYDFIEANEARFAPAIQLAVSNDRSEMYEARMDLLLRNAMIGLGLVLLILGMFLETRLAFWVTLGIPISFAGALIFFPGADLSINMISLFAFIVTLGMVVDDAIVVGESIYDKQEQGMEGLAASIAGAKEVARPVIFSILTTCVAFMPMLFVPGIMGKFFRNLPIVVISVLLISLVESLLVLPAHLSHRMPWWLRGPLWVVFLKPMELLQADKVSKLLSRFIDKVYRPFLAAALEWRYLTLAIGVATLIGTLGAARGGRLPVTFMPKIEGDMITARLEMPVGTSADDTRAVLDRLQRSAEQTLLEGDDGVGISRGITATLGSASVGGNAARAGSSSTGSHVGSAQVYLVESDQRTISTTEFARRWRENLGEVAGVDLLTFKFAIGASPGEPIDIQLSHPDPEILEAAATRLAGQIGVYSGVQDIDSGVNPGKEQLDFTLTDEGRARGLSAASLARQVRGAFFGAEAVRQQRGRNEVRVYVRRPRDERESLHHLERFLVRTPDGGEMPLTQAAEIDRGRAYTEIKRIDGRRVISVTADVDEDVGNADEINTSIEEAELPALLGDIPGLTYSLGGEQQERAESLGALGNGFIIALIVMFAMLAVAFGSYSQPILVMTAIPFGIVGAFWGHLIMGFGLSMMSFMGIVALSGVVVNDSLILIVAINDFRADGMRVWDAVMAGGLRRFRPILLTSLTTFFGLVPMILEPSVQARFLIPMAISLGFGVLFATAIMLLLVPSTYVILEDIRHGLGQMAEALGRPHEESTEAESSELEPIPASGE